MTLYWVEIEIDDDPASFAASVLVVADDRKQALAVGKEKAIGNYNDKAGGWSSTPKITHATASKYDLPKQGVVIISGDYQR